MEYFKRAYYYLFFVLNNVFKYSSDNYNEHKAAISIMIIQVLIFTRLLDLFISDEILKEYELVKLIGVIISVFFATLNYYILIIEKKWKLYEEEFIILKGNRKISAILFVIFFFLFFIWFCFIM